MTGSASKFARTGICLGAAVALTGVSTAALAQDYGAPPPPPAYDQQPYNQQPPNQQPYSQQPYGQQQPGYADQQQPQAYGQQPGYGGPPPASDPYNGQPAPPPPAGYSAQDRQQDMSAQAQQQDQAYAAAQEQWAAANCVRQAQDRAVAGTVIGGILGAVVGSNLARGGGRTGGAVIGGALGAVAGNALARDSGGGMCPQGYAVRSGAPVFAPPAYVVYAAPPEYNPWVFYGGRWVYRSYPYHRYWREHRY